MSKSAETNAKSLARCVLCPQCGYSLEGLPDRGNCPECGFEYSTDFIVLYGSGQGGRKTTTSMSVMVGIMMGVAIAAGMWAPLFFHRRLFASFFQPALLLVAAILAALYRVSLRKEMPAETRLRLSPQGFGMRDGFGEVNWIPWQPGHRVEIMERKREKYLLRITVRRWQFVLQQPVYFVFHADEQTVTGVEHYLTNCLRGTNLVRK
ncbi:MAG TPA: hypothetical protein VL282_05815 [Tepidisphaeraceae bacterium]|nr:hypothetical protein [Tepidisphaeraceae bacterium]